MSTYPLARENSEFTLKFLKYCQNKILKFPKCEIETIKYETPIRCKTPGILNFSHFELLFMTNAPSAHSLQPLIKHSKISFILEGSKSKELIDRVP